jgi:hypothetical protein
MTFDEAIDEARIFIAKGYSVSIYHDPVDGATSLNTWYRNKPIIKDVDATSS